MMKPHGVPHDYVLVLYLPVPETPSSQGIVSTALISEESRSPFLGAIIRCNPDIVIGERSPNLRVIISTQKRTRRRLRNQTVADGIPHSGPPIGINDCQFGLLEAEFDPRIGLCFGRLGDDRPIATPRGIRVRRSDSAEVGFDEGVGAAVDVEIEMVDEEVIMADADRILG